MSMAQQKPRKQLKAGENSILLAAVRSRAIPLDGQDARSSHNYSTYVGSKGATSFLYEVGEDNPNWQSLSFNVKEDISGGSDHVWEENVYSGNRGDVVRKASLYIANPQGAGGGSDYFTVMVYMITV